MTDRTVGHSTFFEDRLSMAFFFLKMIKDQAPSLLTANFPLKFVQSEPRTSGSYLVFALDNFFFFFFAQLKSQLLKGKRWRPNFRQTV